jgi:hypothetical protein
MLELTTPWLLRINIIVSCLALPVSPLRMAHIAISMREGA